MKKYKLLKDLPFSKTGDIWTTHDGEKFGLYTLSVHAPKWQCEFLKQIISNTEWFEEIKEQEFKRWRATVWETYYYIHHSGICESHRETYDNIDDFYYYTGNYFKTEEKAKIAKKLLLAKTRVKDYAFRVNEGWKSDWENKDTGKYFIDYDIRIYMYRVSWSHSIFNFGQVYFKSYELAEKAIEDLRQDLDVIRLNS